MTLISLVLVGFIFIFSGSAWADRDHYRGHYRDHHFHKHHKHGGHHYREHYRHDKHHRWHNGHRYYHKRHQRGPWRRGWRYYRHHPAPIEKHVYHHYSNDDTYTTDDCHEAAVSWAEPGFTFSIGISGVH